MYVHVFVCVKEVRGGGSQLISPLPNYRDQWEHAAFRRQLASYLDAAVVCSVLWLTRNVVMVINYQGTWQLVPGGIEDTG